MSDIADSYIEARFAEMQRHADEARAARDTMRQIVARKYELMKAGQTPTTARIGQSLAWPKDFARMFAGLQIERIPGAEAQVF